VTAGEKLLQELTDFRAEAQEVAGVLGWLRLLGLQISFCELTAIQQKEK
jgi:hypothetical protein